MSVTPERFAQGMTYDEYKAQMTRNQESFTANERGFVLAPDDLTAFTSLPQSLNVLVLAEDWCGDVVANLPILGTIAAASGKLNVRVFLRDQNLDIMDQYLKDGQFRSIPVFVFFDEQFNEIGHFIERPASVTARNVQFRAEFFAQHPELGSAETPVSQLPEDVRVQMMTATAANREKSKPADNQDVVRAFRDIVASVHA